LQQVRLPFRNINYPLGKAKAYAECGSFLVRRCLTAVRCYAEPYGCWSARGRFRAIGAAFLMMLAMASLMRQAGRLPHADATVARCAFTQADFPERYSHPGTICHGLT